MEVPMPVAADDGKAKRSGTVWTASAYIITAVVGSGVLSLAWAVAQLGWLAGPAVVLLFSFVTYYTSSLLSISYRSGDPLYTYMDAVRSKLCGVVQYLNLLGLVIGYTIASSISMMAVKRSNCFHASAVTEDIKIRIPGMGTVHLNMLRMVWSVLVVLTTLISMLMPFFNDVVRLVGAVGFWPLTVYFPVEMYIKQRRIGKWSTRWVCLQILSLACLIISIVAAAGSIAGIVLHLNDY